jgi:hypothetical protein
MCKNPRDDISRLEKPAEQDMHRHDAANTGTAEAFRVERYVNVLSSLMLLCFRNFPGR